MTLSISYLNYLRLKIEVNESLELLKADINSKNTFPSSYSDIIELRNGQIMNIANSNTVLNNKSALVNEKRGEPTLNLSSSELSDLTSLSDMILSSPINNNTDKTYEARKSAEKDHKIKKIILTFHCPKYKLAPLNEKLLSSLLSIHYSKRNSVECMIKDNIMLDKDVGICYYSYKLHKWYQKNLKSSKKEIKNNFLLLLFKIGEYTSINKCGLKFKNSLSYFKEYPRYLEVYKVCKVVYRIWNPLPSRDLLKIDEFKFNQFIRLKNRDILRFRQTIHSII